MHALFCNIKACQVVLASVDRTMLLKCSNSCRHRSSKEVNHSIGRVWSKHSDNGPKKGYRFLLGAQYTPIVCLDFLPAIGRFVPVKNVAVRRQLGSRTHLQTLIPPNCCATVFLSRTWIKLLDMTRMLIRVDAMVVESPC
jgi:hypothetical protein